MPAGKQTCPAPCGARQLNESENTAVDIEIPALILCTRQHANQKAHQRAGVRESNMRKLSCHCSGLGVPKKGPGVTNEATFQNCHMRPRQLTCSCWPWPACAATGAVQLGNCRVSFGLSIRRVCRRASCGSFSHEACLQKSVWLVSACQNKEHTLRNRRRFNFWDAGARSSCQVQEKHGSGARPSSPTRRYAQTPTHKIKR